ncbi:beta(1,4)galactosyltransferase, partial [Lactobacillus delbrueckii subsp. bulgaricus]|nr:beta(1,4)galactosyltransferase [Lactobacillus delbrueckii subsp. bulgaricus]
DYLEDCVHSLELQTYKNIEIILVDDGSPDRSGKICDKLALKDARIKVIHKKNGGLSDARNEGLEHSNGEYIAFVDSDDMVEPNFIKVLYSLITQGNYQVSQIGTQFVNESGDPLNQKIVFDGDMGKKLNGNYVLNRDELIKGLLLRKVHCAA